MEFEPAPDLEDEAATKALLSFNALNWVARSTRIGWFNR